MFEINIKRGEELKILLKIECERLYYIVYERLTEVRFLFELQFAKRNL